MSNITILSLQETSVPQGASSLITTFLLNALWVWPLEDPDVYPVPLAPGNTQRVFRKTWTNTSPSTRTPSSIMIAIAVDNFFDLFVNGDLVHVLSPADRWDEPSLFSVPISENTIVIGIRAANHYADRGAPLPSPAGVRAAFEIAFSPVAGSSGGPSTETLYTGSDNTWLSNRIYSSGWEQPWYNDGGWTPVNAIPDPDANGTITWGSLRGPKQLWVASQPGPQATTPSGLPGQNCYPTSRIAFSDLGLGLMLGFSLAAALLGGAGIGWFASKRKYGHARVYGGVNVLE